MRCLTPEKQALLYLNPIIFWWCRKEELFMRTAAVALVLIVGAAVVLWFGNMLNSWVIGGLMGGLAALLLSIPISLTLFSYLARRHDEQLRAAEQQVVLAQTDIYGYEDAAEVAALYESEDYESSYEDDWYAQYNDRRPATRNLPAQIYPRLPAAGQSHAPAFDDVGSHQRNLNYPTVARQQSGTAPIARGKNVPVQRPSPARRTYYPGFPGYSGNSPRSLHQSAALRAARQEAAQQRNDVEVIRSHTNNLKRLPPPRTTPGSTEHSLRSTEPRTSRELPQQVPPIRRRRTVDSELVPPGYPQRQGGNLYPQTEPINENAYYPRTGPVRQQTTGQLRRNRQLDEQYRNPQTMTGSIKNPLVRRPPYMYEDDPLRQELAQHIDTPIVRRSSRYEEYEEE